MMPGLAFIKMYLLLPMLLFLSATGSRPDEKALAGRYVRVSPSLPTFYYYKLKYGVIGYGPSGDDTIVLAADHVYERHNYSTDIRGQWQQAGDQVHTRFVIKDSLLGFDYQYRHGRLYQVATTYYCHDTLKKPHKTLMVYERLRP